MEFGWRRPSFASSSCLHAACFSSWLPKVSTWGHFWRLWLQWPVSRWQMWSRRLNERGKDDDIWLHWFWTKEPLMKFKQLSPNHSNQTIIIGEDGIFFRGGAGPQFSSRSGHDFQPRGGPGGGLRSGIFNVQMLPFSITKGSIRNCGPSRNFFA